MASASGSDVITVLSWNINGLKEKFKRRDRKTELLEIFGQYDIVLLQETHIGKDDKTWENITKTLSKEYDLINLEDLTCRETADNQEEEEGEEGEEEEDEEEEKEKETMRKKIYMTNFHPRSKGVAIIVNKPHTLLSSFSEGGYYAGVHVEIDQQKYMFVSVYYCPKYPHLIPNLMRKISTERSDAFKCRVVIGGDFNTTLNRELDVITVNSKHAARREIVKEFLRAVKLIDVWRETHPGESKYTRTYTNKDNKEKTTQSRLDYVFMLEDDVKYVKRCEILNDIDLSDHSPVSLTLNYTNDRRA